MKRGELRPVTSNGLPNPVCSGSKFSYGKEKPAHDSSASKTTFQILAENCGFKVIKEESKDHFDCHPMKNRSEASITRAAENMPSRLQSDNNMVSREVIVVSRVNNVMDTENKERKSTGTYLVTRNNGDVAPKVDFLDMTDASDTLDNSLQNVVSKKYNISGEHKSAGEAGEQCTAKQECQGESTNGQKRWPRYKIMKREQWPAKHGGKDERNKSTAGGKLKKRSVDRPKSSHGADRSREQQPEVLKLSSRRTNPRILLCDSSSVLTKDGEFVGEKDEPDKAGKEHNNGQACNTTTGLQVKGSNHGNNADRSVDSHQGGDQVFSNVNSSCLHPAAVQEVRLQPRKKNIVGGMLAYLRKMSSTLNNERRSNLRGSFSKEVAASSRRFFNRQSNNKTAKSKATDKRVYQDTQMLLPAAKLKKKGPSYSQQYNISSRNLRVTSGMSKYDIGTCDVDRDNATTRFPQLYRTTSDIPMSASLERGIDGRFLLDRNCPQDYNINFNSEDEYDDEESFNSFIGGYLCQLWKRQCLCDVRLKVGNTSILAHKIVLAAYTDLFCPDDPQQIPTVSFDVPDVTEEALNLILEYLYTAKMDVNDSVLESLYIAGSVMEIPEITELVIHLLSKPTVHNFEKYLNIRQNLGLPANIMDVYTEFVLENLLEIEDSPSILGMQLADMEKLLRDPSVKIDCEADIFRMIIKWLKYNPGQRTRHAADLLRHVDFDCVGPETLSSIVEQNRHLFDLSSMDIIMGAFKKFALKCKDATMKDAGSHGEVHNKMHISKTNDQQYTCLDCGKEFAQMSSLSRHRGPQRICCFNFQRPGGGFCFRSDYPPSHCPYTCLNVPDCKSCTFLQFGRAKCFCNTASSMARDNTGNYSEDEVYEVHKPWVPEPSPVNDRYIPEVEVKSRKSSALSPREIRKLYTTGEIQVESTDCSQNEATKRISKTGSRYSCSNARPEIQYTIRQKNRLCDSSNNFPSEYCDLRSRSSSSESRRGQFYKGLNSSRSDTDAGLATPVCDCCGRDCCGLPEGHLGRRRSVYACSGSNNHDPDRLSSRCEPECSSNYTKGPRQCRDVKKTTRRVSCNQAGQRSRSSSQSSASSLRYNGSSSGSSKRVTFS